MENSKVKKAFPSVLKDPKWCSGQKFWIWNDKRAWENSGFQKSVWKDAYLKSSRSVV